MKTTQAQINIIINLVNSHKNVIKGEKQYIPGGCQLTLTHQSGITSYWVYYNGSHELGWEVPSKK